MIDIKFRQWLHTKEMLYGVNWIKQAEDMGIYMQYTGLNDKNGKEIYEGDIVEVSFPDNWCYEKGDTERHQNAGKVVSVSEVKANEKRFLHFYVFPNDSWYVYKVVGNIYENPGLLK